MRLPRANVITLILYRPSTVETSLGTLVAYSASSMELHDFLDTDIPTAKEWLSKKFADDIRLRDAESFHKPVTCECLVNGVPIDVFPNPDVKTDMRSLVREAFDAATVQVNEELRLKAELAARRAKTAQNDQFTADMIKIRELASKYDSALLTNNEIVMVKL